MKYICLHNKSLELEWITRLLDLGLTNMYEDEEREQKCNIMTSIRLKISVKGSFPSNILVDSRADLSKNTKHGTVVSI